MGDYKIVLEEGTGEIVEKKSRFIAYVKPVSSESEASSFIESIKKKHWDAKHNCSAFVIGENNETTRCSDDGEPSGTAGRPMLEILTKEGYHNVCVVVTRYFGGVLLGTGGLIRAYQAATKEGLENTPRGSVNEGMRLFLTVNYNDIGKIQNLAANNGETIENAVYGENVSLELIVPIEQAQQREKDITELTGAKAIINDREKCKMVTRL